MQTPKGIWWLTIPLFAGIVFSSYTGMSTPGFYDQETLNWQIQCEGQDFVDLLLVSPLLLISAWLIKRGVKIAFPVWAGTNLYIAYTFLIFCFDVHFNSLFLVYCLNLGLSGYALLYFLYYIHQDYGELNEKKRLFRICSVYFIIIAIMFYALWLSGILPHLINSTTPKEVIDIAMPTNPVHVIDLSLLLPAVFGIGILLWKKHTIGIRLAPAILVFFILMNITIALLNYMMMKQLPDIHPVITWVMMSLSVFSFVIWYQFLSVFKPVRV